jgi:hypothetical protein
MNCNCWLSDEKPYILSDPEFEKEFGCHIAKVLEKPNRNELFKVWQCPCVCMCAQVL